MTTDVTQRVDLVADSLDHLLALSFTKSSSPSYPLAVNVAQQASKYHEMRIGRTLIHLAAFAKSREQAARALALIRYVQSWKATQIFTAGALTQVPWRLTSVLECYLEATSCNDWTAHCHKIVEDPYETLKAGPVPTSFQISLSDEPARPRTRLVDHYRFPCRYLLERGHFRFEASHPASAENQIQAGAVKAGCAWCPQLDVRRFEKLGTGIRG